MRCSNPLRLNSSVSLILLLSWRLFGVLLVTLHDDQVVVPIGRYHHIVDFARDAQEGQIVLRVQITNQAASRYRQLWQTHRVARCFWRFTHRRSHDLWLIALLHLRLLHNDQALDALMSLDSGDSFLDFALYRSKKMRVMMEIWFFNGSKEKEHRRLPSFCNYFTLLTKLKNNNLISISKK